MTKRSQRDPWDIGLSVLASVASVPGLFFALLIRAFACDESSCDGGSSSWRDDAGAWQWDAQLGLGVLGALCAFFALWAALTRRNPIPALCLSVAAWVGWWIWAAGV